MTNSINSFQKGQYFKHIDGGYYQFDRIVYSSEDRSLKVVYDHLWPFEVGGWERPSQEFFDKFTPITKEEFDLAKKEDQVQLQQKIIAHKEQRRANQNKSA